jgi:hypothetical protein
VHALPEGYAISRGRNSLLLALPQVAGACSEVHRGDTAPILGWVSRRFDEKQPTPTIAWRARLKGEIVLRSDIAC